MLSFLVWFDHAVKGMQKAETTKARQFVGCTDRGERSNRKNCAPVLSPSLIIPLLFSVPCYKGFINKLVNKLISQTSLRITGSALLSF